LSRIIDIHAHAFPEEIAWKAVKHIGSHYSINMYGKGIISDLMESAERSGVDYMVIHSTATKATQVKNVNDWVAAHAKGKFIGFGTLHPDMDDIEGEFERIISLGLKGIKLHPDFQGFDADDAKMDRIYSLIENRLPLLIHAGDENLDSSSPQRLSNVLEKFPGLTMIAAHLGGFKNWNEAMDCLIGKNLYLDTSSAIQYLDKDFAVRIIKTHGTDKVVFGTDYPSMYHQMELEAFHKLDLNDQEKEDILYNNAARLLGLSPP
jgi:predicted TIM-barrel fold metal-dependent hydrolase